jgi:hypothetical protein
MHRYPDDYKSKVCEMTASSIETQAESLEVPQYMDIKKKLLEYSSRKNRISVNSSFHELREIFQTKAGDIYEPLALSREINVLLEKTVEHPVLKDDLQEPPTRHES